MIHRLAHGAIVYLAVALGLILICWAIAEAKIRRARREQGREERKTALSAIANAQRWLMGPAGPGQPRPTGGIIEGLDVAILLVRKPSRPSFSQIIKALEYSPGWALGAFLFYIALLILLRLAVPEMGETESMTMALAALIAFTEGRKR